MNPELAEQFIKRMADLCLTPDVFDPGEYLRVEYANWVIVSIDCKPPDVGKWVYVAHPHAILNDILSTKPKGTPDK